MKPIGGSAGSYGTARALDDVTNEIQYTNTATNKLMGRVGIDTMNEAFGGQSLTVNRN